MFCGWIGLRGKELLPPPTQNFPSSLTEEQRKDRRAKPYPRSISEAVEGFEQSTEFKKLMIESALSVQERLTESVVQSHLKIMWLVPWLFVRVLEHSLRPLNRVLRA